jgi:hypothetical protein
MKECIIQNAYCTPQSCANCTRVFCAHEHPELRAFGSYGQYCSRDCQDAKNQQVFALGQERFNQSRIVLIVEEGYCYLVCNKHKREKNARGYGFKILQESAKAPGEKLVLDYCYYPGFSSEDHPVTYEMRSHLQVAIAINDEYDNSMWTIVGFRLLDDGTIDTYGVGGHIEVIDMRVTITDAIKGGGAEREKSNGSLR